jgi:hypothetical protein
MPCCAHNLSEWIRNNWRPYHTSRGFVPNERKKSRLDIIWMEMKERVKNEIIVMMEEEGLTSDLTAGDLQTLDCRGKTSFLIVVTRQSGCDSEKD